MEKPVRVVRINRAEYLDLRERLKLEALVKGWRRLLTVKPGDIPLGAYWMDEDGTVYAPSSED